jgi:rRNA maturation endonuclease Nob1
MNFCPNCGAKLQENAKYCSDCGYNLTEMKPEHDSSASSVPFLRAFLKYKKLVIGAIGTVILLSFTYSYFNSDEKRALKVAQEFFEEECEERGCEFDSFYEVETQLKQKEDEDLEQPGRYRISAGVKLKSKESGEYQYYRFGMNVEFLDGEYQRAGYPSINTDYEKEEE